ncbi:MAG TPA: hypothetical protein VJ691_17100 [Vicinamibacterales bacterium]|nr:hypothetical protein [Vicinamibacterales bacterium]
MALILVIVAALVGTACTNSPATPTSPSLPPAASTTTRLFFTSDPASFVGQGQSRTYTLQNATFHPLIGHAGRYLSIVIRPTDPADTSLSWSMVMMAPFGQQLSPATYSAGEVDAFAPFFSFGGGGRACGSGTTATFTIHEIATSGETLQRLRMSFTMYCGGSATVRGEVVILADPWR